jgi:hypothetical protein
LSIANSERGAARNAGAKIATGTYLNFFDSDDVPFRHHLSTALAFAESNGTPPWFHTGFEIVDERGAVLVTEVGSFVPYEQLIVTNYLGCDCVFVRRDFFLLHRFSEDRRMASSEDWHLWLRLLAREKLKICSVVTLKMIHHPNRSLVTISTERIIERDTVMLKSLLKDELFVKKFSQKLPLFEADRYTFFSLSLALSENRARALGFLLKALRCTSLVLSRRRFWASLRIVAVGPRKGKGTSVTAGQTSS